MRSNRRDFIKISSMGIGGAAVAAPAFNWAEGAIKADSKKPGSEYKRTSTYCEICFWKCAGWVYSNDEGHIWKIEGNADDQHCNGRLCPRGTGGVGMYNDTDRLKTPLIRKTKNGKQVFKEASWDEAFEYIAKKMNKIAIITGATSGIGSSFAKILASRGYNLIITGRRKEKIQKLANEAIARFEKESQT